MKNQNIKNMPNYNSFTIKKFKAIDSIEIDLTNSSLIPLVGINESGKTTILEAIHSFFDLSLNKKSNGKKVYYNKHTADKSKDYNTTIKASISIEKDKLKEIVSSVIESKKNGTKTRSYDLFLNKINDLGTENESVVNLSITLIIKHENNDLYNIQYSIDIYGDDISHVEKQEIVNQISEKIILIMPTISYITSFNHNTYFNPIVLSPDDRENSPLGNCIRIVEEYNKKNSSNYDIFEIKKETIEKFNHGVSRYLTDEIIQSWKEWFNSEIDMQINFKIYEENEETLIKFTINEADGTDYGGNTPFTLNDRSQGFIWFFNYMLETKFSSKAENEGKRIFLLDEPGAYLHPKAQENFCAKLQEISQPNLIIYSTHSPYMLNPEYIQLIPLTC